MMKNDKTFQIACIAFLCKICYGVFAYDTVAGLLNNTDEVKLILEQMGNMERLISANVPDEQGTFFEIFDAIGDEVLAYCFSNALDDAEAAQNTFSTSCSILHSSYGTQLKKLNSSTANAISI